MTRLVELLRATPMFVLNWLTAVLGTAIAEAEFEHFFHPRTIRAILLREIVLSAAVSFLLGYLAYFKWKSTSAKWIWIVGVCGYSFGIATGGKPFEVQQDIGRATLTFVSLRAVCYSLGAVTSEALTPLLTELIRPWRTRGPNMTPGSGPPAAS